MNDKILSLTATSPEDLAYRLSELSDNERKQYKFLSLAISGPDVLVQPFNIPGITVKEIKDRLKLVCVELLNVPLDQIAFDYQVLSSNEERVCGLFSCAPKSLIDDYNNVFKVRKLQPLKITPYILAVVDAFYQQNEAEKQRFSLLDFTREGYINLAVIHQQRFQLLRKVRYDNTKEAMFEIQQSLRSACAKSSVKHFDHIFLSGTIPEQEKIVSEIEESFSTKTLYKDDICINESLARTESYFSINLIRNEAVSLKERKYILMGFHGLIVLSMLLCYLTSVKITQKDQQIQQLTQQAQMFDSTFTQIEKTDKSGDIL